MPLSLPLDHPTLLLKPKIQEVTKNFLDAFGFNYFQYLRCFVDGSVSLLTNNTGLFEYFAHIDNSPVVFSAYENKHENTPSYWLLWDDDLPAMPVQLARERFNLRNGLTLVRRFKNYYDMIGVALPNEQANPGSFYLNKLRAIEQFILEFDSSNPELIGLLNQHPIALPEPYRDNNYKKICLTKGKISVLGKEGRTYITTQELACLRLLIQGASQKNIAQALGISLRTVETYMLRVRQRTNLHLRRDFECMLNYSGAV